MEKLVQQKSTNEEKGQFYIFFYEGSPLSKILSILDFILKSYNLMTSSNLSDLLNIGQWLLA